jgi:hypothetical protein
MSREKKNLPAVGAYWIEAADDPAALANIRRRQALTRARSPTLFPHPASP